VDLKLRIARPRQPGVYLRNIKIKINISLRALVRCFSAGAQFRFDWLRNTEKRPFLDISYTTDDDDD